MRMLSRISPSTSVFSWFVGSSRMAARASASASSYERWFIRAKAAKKYDKFHLIVNPNLATTIAESEVNRVERLMKAHKFRINLVRDTTMPQHEFHIYNADDNTEITELYKV